MTIIETRKGAAPTGRSFNFDSAVKCVYSVYILALYGYVGKLSAKQLDANFGKLGDGRARILVL